MNSGKYTPHQRLIRVDRRLQAICLIILACGLARGQSTETAGGALTNQAGMFNTIAGMHEGGSLTQWDVVCQVPNIQYAVANCQANPGSIAGVAENVGPSIVSVIRAGETLVNSSNSAVIGDLVSVGAASPQVTDCGSTTSCTSGTAIGVVEAISQVDNIYILYDGVAFVPSPTRPMIALMVPSQSIVGPVGPIGATGAMGPIGPIGLPGPQGPPGSSVLPLCSLTPTADVIALVGTVSETAFTTNCSIPANTLAAGVILRLRAAFDVTSKSVGPTITFRVRYGGTGIDGTRLLIVTPNIQSANLDRTGEYSLVLAGTATLGTLYSAGEVFYPSATSGSQQGGIFTAQAADSTQTIYLTVSAVGGVGAGTQVQLLTLEVD